MLFRSEMHSHPIPVEICSTIQFQQMSFENAIVSYGRIKNYSKIAFVILDPLRWHFL